MTHHHPSQLPSPLSSSLDAAWIDRPHAGWVRMEGADRLDLLQRLTTNDLTPLREGKGLQTVLLTEKARIIDVLTVLEFGTHTMLITSMQPPTPVISWLKKYIIMDDVRLRDASSAVHMLEVMGPRSSEAVHQLTGVGVAELAGCAKTDWIQHGEITVVRMPSSLEVSYWLIAAPEHLAPLREALINAADHLPQLTNEQDTTLRVRSGMGAIGHEWTEAYNPLEAGLLHLTNFAKGCYIGQEVVARLDSYNKVKQRVMGFSADTPIAEGDAILAADAIVGVLTTVVAVGGTWKALGYIRGEHATAGATIHIQHDDRSPIPATIHQLPFEA